MTQKHTVVFTGESYAGKSTLAAMLANRQDMPLFAVGGFERAYAKNLGYDDIVQFEREFGLEKAYYSLIPTMLQHIKGIGCNGTKEIVIEGVYDPCLYGEISAIFANKLCLVSVTAPIELRMSRKVGKECVSIEAAKQHILQLDLHKEMVGNKELAKMVNLRIINDSDLEGAYKELESKLRHLLR